MKSPLTSLAKRVVRLWPSPVLVRRRGARFLLHPHNWIDNRIIAGAPFEIEQLKYAREAIQKHDIDLVIDIGANIGLYSVLLGLMPQVKTVLAFEPVRRNYAQLMGNVFVNGLTLKVDATRAALGASAGQSVIHIDPRSTGISRISLENTARKADVFQEHEQIEIVTFDSICGLRGRKAFVKIDVEGSAAAVLLGMKTFNIANSVVLQVELSDSERDAVLALLSEQGFTKLREIDADAIFTRGL
jgi:FkbM family methyltransferase